MAASPSIITTDQRQDQRHAIDTEVIEKGPTEHLDGVVKLDQEVVPNTDKFGSVTTYTPEERALVRKLDLYIMPMVWAMYYLNKTDQNAIANARLKGLEKDLGLHGGEFNVCVSILYVGYLLMQIPSNALMASRKVRPSLWLAGWTMAWAVCSALTAVVKDYKGLLVVRFFLGWSEAPFYPGAVFLLSCFYTRKEIAARISILYSGTIFATAFAGLISAAVFNTLEGVHGIRGWEWLFIILGVVTFAVGALSAFVLPDSPLTTRWLTPEQRILAQERMDRDTVGLEESKGTLAGFRQAVSDPKLYLFVALQNMHLASCGFNSFFPTVVKTLGYSVTITLVLTCPIYIVAGVFSIGLGFSSGRFNERTYHITFGMVIGAIGFIMAASTLNTAARFVALFLFSMGAYSANSVILGWVASTLGQTPEKKAVALSIVNTVSMASFIYTPYLYPASDGPRYLMANATNAAFSIGVAICTWAMRFWLQRENRRIRSENNDARLLFVY